MRLSEPAPVSVSQIDTRLMPHSNSFARRLLTCSLLIGLLSGLILPSLSHVQAAPQQQAATSVVISEFRTRGPDGAADEFVEIYNATASPISIANWQLRVLTGGENEDLRATIPTGVVLNQGQHYLFANNSANGYSGSVTPDQTYSVGIVDTGGIAIFDDLNNKIDSVGLDTPPDIYAEGNPLVPLSGALDQSYERYLDVSGGCVDTDNNNLDFFLLVPSNPQNSSSSLTTCDDPAPFTATAAFNQTSTALAANQTGTAAANLTGTAFGNETATSAALTATSTPPAPLSVVINEVAWSGTAVSSSDEWMELYNPGSTCINLTGWKLTADSGQPNIALSGVIAAGGYFLLERATDKDDTPISDIVEDQMYSGALSNTGDKLRLLNPNGIQIDTANIDGGAWPAGSTVNNRSMERYRPNALDAANNWVTNTGVVRNGKAANGSPINGTPRQRNWAFTVTLTSTPRPPTKVPTKLPTPVPRLVINEFLPRAGFDWNQDGAINTFDEFIEIANDSGINVSLSGWRLQVVGGSSKPYTLPNLLLKPGDHALFYGRQTNLLLSDGGGTIQLVNPRGVIMDAQTYGVILKPDQSWCRLPDTRGSWYSDCFPTPNQTNSRVGTVPSLPPGTGLEAPVCLLPDTLPVEFRQAECYGYGANMWQAGYWNREAGQSDRIVPQNESKWETFVE